jgi:hypothetical protein
MNNPFAGFPEKVLDYFVKYLAPDNVLAFARGETPMSENDKKQALEIVETSIMPGDLILTQTPSMLFSLFRDVGET